MRNIPNAVSRLALGTLAIVAAAQTVGCRADSAERDPGDAPPITATPGSALHQAQVCQQKLGKIPTWSCRDGVPIPIEVGGVATTTDQGTCDNADLKGRCAPGSYVGHLPGVDLDGGPKPSVQWVFFCRRDDNFAQMIGHDTETGATCFFELKDGYMPLEAGVPAAPVPGIDDPTYEAAWKRPDQIAPQGCNHCHTPDPFIHTPFIDRARRSGDPAQTVVPQIATPTSPYYVMGSAYAGWTLDYVAIENNACTSCHRLPDFTRFTKWSGVDFNAHMPPLAPGSMRADFDKVMACLSTGPGNGAGCRWAALNGATPTGNPAPKPSQTEGQGTFSTTFGSLGSGAATFGNSRWVFSSVGARAGQAGAGGNVQLDVTGNIALDAGPGIGITARFLVPVDRFRAGTVLTQADRAWSSQLFITVPGATRETLIASMVQGTLRLTKAGSLPGDAVEGSFAITWQDDGK